MASHLPQLHAVVEEPWFEGPPPWHWPWPIEGRNALTRIRLSGATTQLEVGSFVAQLVKYNQLDADGTPEEWLQAIITAESLILPGGIQASDGERVIDPGCCCGLETWREWFDLLQSGTQPWTGHDPSPWVQLTGNMCRFWSDGGMGAVQGAFAIDFERERFSSQLQRVEHDLQAFLALVARWAEAIQFADVTALCSKIDTCFYISRAADEPNP